MFEIFYKHSISFSTFPLNKNIDSFDFKANMFSYEDRKYFINEPEKIIISKENILEISKKNNKKMDEMKFTILFMDYINVEKKKQRYFLHWLISDIGLLEKDNIYELNYFENCKTHVNYYPPTPPINTGRHRYIYFILLQKNDLGFNKIQNIFNYEMKEQQSNFQPYIFFRNYGNYFYKPFQTSYFLLEENLPSEKNNGKNTNKNTEIFYKMIQN